MPQKKKQLRFARNESGAVALEFALLAPILFFIMFGIVEFSCIMLTSAVIENATANAARMGKTGYTQAGVSRQTLIFNMVKARGVGLVDPTKVAITTLSYRGMDQVHDPEPFSDSNHNGVYNVGEPFTDVNTNGQWDEDMGIASLGGAGDMVVYTVNYPWRVITPLLSSLIGTNGVFTITSSAVVRNEPYDYGT